MNTLHALLGLAFLSSTIACGAAGGPDVDSQDPPPAVQEAQSSDDKTNANDDAKEGAKADPKGELNPQGISYNVCPQHVADGQTPCWGSNNL